MHIAYYSPAWPPKNVANGIVTYVKQMKDALEKKGHQVSVVTSKEIFTASGEQIELHAPMPNLARRLINRFWSFPNWHVEEGTRIAHAIRQHCPDIDLVEMEESFGFVNALQRLLPKPVVVRLHGPNFLCQIDQLSGASMVEFEKRTKNEGVAIQSARYISAPTAHTLRETLSRYCANPKIADAIFNPAPEYDGIPWSLEKSKQFEILHVGRFDRLKGADLVIQAFCLVAAKYEDARLVMVGPETGLQVDTGERLNFGDYCRRYVPEELRDRISYLGSQGPMEVNACRLRSHITIMASRFETMSYAALETLSVGAPLISANGFADDALVIDGETGWSFHNGSAKSLAEAISKAFDSGSDIKHIAESGRKRCQNHFYPDVIAPKMIAFYETVLKDYYS